MVELKDGRIIHTPLHWYQRLNVRWEPCGAGYGIHWPDIDEDLSAEGMLKGNRAD